MQFIDTHTHIYGEEFSEDRSAVIRRAIDAGAVGLLLPNVDEASIEPMLSLCRKFSDLCHPMMGLQPEELPADPAPLLQKMYDLLEANLSAPVTSECDVRFVAIGEVGIDLYWDASRRDEQIEVFRQEVEWAVKFQLPLVIHCRAAHRDLCDVLKPYADSLAGGIFHCFGGTEQEARELLEFPGFYLGIGGIVTFKKSTLPQVLSSAVPLSRILLETDAPYLTPVPYRGKRNEPAYIPYIINKLAEVYATTPAEVAHLTTINACRLFRIRQAP